MVSQRVGRNAGLKQIDAFRKQLEEGRLALMMEAVESAFWDLPKLLETCGVLGVNVVEFWVNDGPKWTKHRVVHNLPKGGF